jgi:hypothetical protein
MGGAEELLFDRDGPPVKSLGLLWITPRVANRGKVVEADGDVLVTRAEDTFEHGEGTTDKSLGFLTLALTVQNRGQGCGVGGDVRVCRSECSLADLESVPRETLSRCVLAPGVREAAEVVMERGYLDGLLTAGREEEGHRTPVCLLGFVEPALRLVEHPQIVQENGDLDVV